MNTPDRSAPKRFDTALMGEVGLCVVLLVVFGLMFVNSYDWEIEAALFPRLISGLGMGSVLAYISQLIWRNLKGQGGRAQRILDIPWAKVTGESGSVKKAAFGIIAWTMAFWLGIVLVGFHVAAPLYLYAQLVIYGEVKKWVAALGALVCLLIIILVYDRLAETTWNDPVLFDLVKALFSI